MHNRFQLAFKYLNYYVSAGNSRGHGIHSPFVFDFIIQVLRDDRFYYAYHEVEKLRALLLQDVTLIEIMDFGAGSAGLSRSKRKVCDIAKWSLKPAKYGQLLFRMVNYYQPKVILELGTSLGVTTSYLAKGRTFATVHTLEGAPALASLAKRHFAHLGLTNILVTEGNFDITLPSILGKTVSPDFVFIDGNHKLEPTLRYFNWLLPFVHSGSIFVFDDIHWSLEMEQAWQTIQSHQAVTCSIDLFFVGIVFFSPDFKERQNFSIRF